MIADLDLLPVIFGTDWRFIYLQKLTGTVTIVPDAPLWAYFRVLSDPNLDRMQAYIRGGEKATWYKLCRISNHYRVEKMLMECTRVLEKRAQQAGLPLQRERISHVNAGVVPNGAADGHGSTSVTIAKPSLKAHGHHQSTKKVHVNFTNQDSSQQQQQQQAAAQRAYFHLNGAATTAEGDGRHSSPSSSPNLRPQQARASRERFSSDEAEDADADIETEEPLLQPELNGEIERSITADLLTQGSDAGWRRGEGEDTDQTDEDEQTPMT